jgi:hypothetical protein
MVDRRMYVTGGIGSTHKGERFTEDYHLPNDTFYAETCATVGSIFWNQRMFLLTGDTQYLNLVERTLYNGFLAGISLNATEFFYANPLQVDSDGHALHDVDPIRFANERQDWFDCACCPPNVACLLASLGDYLYARSASTDAIYVNHFVGSEVIFSIRDTDVRLRQETKYPWAGDVTLRIDVAKSVPFPSTFAFRTGAKRCPQLSMVRNCRWTPTRSISSSIGSERRMNSQSRSRCGQSCLLHIQRFAPIQGTWRSGTGRSSTVWRRSITNDRFITTRFRRREKSRRSSNPAYSTGW